MIKKRRKRKLEIGREAKEMYEKEEEDGRDEKRIERERSKGKWKA
jgi:hypothetical protein